MNIILATERYCRVYCSKRTNRQGYSINERPTATRLAPLDQREGEKPLVLATPGPTPRLLK